MGDERPTRKMEALDLRLLAEATAECQRPTGRMEKVELVGLLSMPEVAGDGPRFPLTVITTPPELRERWENWVRLRNSFVLVIALTIVLVSLIRLV